MLNIYNMYFLLVDPEVIYLTEVSSTFLFLLPAVLPVCVN